MPASATARDRLVVLNPRLRNSTWNNLAGSTNAMYWSPAMMFRPNAVAATVPINLPVVLARNNTGVISLESRPNLSSMVPKASAPMISQMVNNMLSMPPRDSNESTAGVPVLAWKPLDMASQVPLTKAAGEDNSGLSTKSSTTCGCRNAANTPATMAEAVMASEGGTFFSDNTMRNASGSRFSGVIQNMSFSCSSSVAITPPSTVAAWPKKPMQANTMIAINIAGTDVQACARKWA